MRCSIQGCPGSYEETTVVHTMRRAGAVLVVDHVPTEVCPICGDTLFSPATLRSIEELLSTPREPAGTVPLYEFARAG